MFVISGFRIFLLLTLLNNEIGGCMQRNLVTEDLLERAEIAEIHKDYNTAIKLYHQLTHHYETSFGPEHQTTISIYQRLYNAYLSSQKPGEALQMIWKIYKIKEKIHGKEHADTAKALSKLAETYYILKNDGKAEELFKRAYRITKSQLGQNHKDTLNNLFNLAQIYQKSKDPEKNSLALPYFRKVYDVRSKDPELGEEHKDTLEALINVGYCLAMEKNLEEAAGVFGKVFDIRRATLGEDHPLTQEVRELLLVALREDGKTGQMNELLRQEHSEKGKDDDESFLSLVDTKATALEKEGKFAQAATILTNYYNRAISKGQLLPGIFVILDKLISYGEKTGDFEQTLNWAKVTIDLVENQTEGQHQKVKVTCEEDAKNMAIVYLNAVEKLIEIYAEQNVEPKIDQWFKTAKSGSRSRSVDLIKGQESKVKAIDTLQQFLTLEDTLPNFREDICTTHEGTALYLKIAANLQGENPRKNLIQNVVKYYVEKVKEYFELENNQVAFSHLGVIKIIWSKEWTENFSTTSESDNPQGLGMTAFNQIFLGLEESIIFYQDKLATEPEMDAQEREMILKHLKNTKEKLGLCKMFLKISTFFESSQVQSLEQDGLDLTSGSRKNNEL